MAGSSIMKQSKRHIRAKVTNADRSNDHISWMTADGASIYSDKSKKLYLFAFALYLIAYNLNFTTFRELSILHLDVFYLGVRVFCTIVLIALILRSGFSRWQIALFSICACIIISSTVFSGSWNILLLFLFVVAGDDIDVRDIAAVSFWCSLGVIVVTVSAATVGFISTVTMNSLNNTLRQAPGFTHPNSLGVLLLSMTCAFTVLRFRKATLVDLLFYGFMYYLCRVVVFSRTSALCMLLLASLAILATLLRGRVFDRLLIALGIGAFIFLSITTYYFMYSYNPSVGWMRELDSVLSARLALMHYFTVSFPPVPFGFDFDGVSIRFGIFTTFLVDNAYAHLVLESGILVAILMDVAWLATLAQAFRCGELSPAIFGLIIFSFVAFCETSAFFICINFNLIGISEALYSMRREKSISVCTVGAFHD